MITFDAQDGDESVKIERIAVQTGNQLIDQFETMCFGLAVVSYVSM